MLIIYKLGFPGRRDEEENHTRDEVSESAPRILQTLYGVIGFHRGMSPRLKHSDFPGPSGGLSAHFDPLLSPPVPLVKMFGELLSRYFSPSA